MTKATNYIPDGFNTVSVFLIADGADGLIEFMTKGLGGELGFVMRDNDKKVSHASVKIGNSTIMLGDTMRGMEPQSAMLYLYVKDPDSLYNKAVKAGAESIREMKDEYWGDRAGGVKDKWGNTWWFAAQVEDLSPDEVKRRAEEAYKKEAEVAAH